VNLEQLVESCEGALCAVVMGPDGTSLESHTRGGSLDPAAISRELAFVLGQMRRAGEILEAGPLHEVTLESERLVLIVRILGGDRFLGLALSPTGNLGRGRYLTRLYQLE
jgi:predicted regulator of Ras-like GTPase activity (Roadblock/LC7/MglB family)